MNKNVKQKHKLVIKSYIHDEIVFERWFDSIEHCFEVGEGLVNCRQRDGLLEYVDIYTQAYLFNKDKEAYKSTSRYYFYNAGSKEFGIMLHESEYDG